MTCDLLRCSSSSIEHTKHIDIVDVLEILVCQVYCRFDNRDASILIAHICASKVNDSFWREKETWNYRNKTSNRAQLRVYRLESLIYKLGIRNITFVCLRRQQARSGKAHSPSVLRRDTYFGFYLKLPSHLLYDFWGVCGAPNIRPSVSNNNETKR